MFKINQETLNAAQKTYDGPIILEPGIHSNLKLVSCEKNVTKNQNPYLKFIFSQDGKIVHEHTEYSVKDNDPKAEDKRANVAKRIAHILIKSFGESKITQSTLSSFDDLCNWCISIVEANKTNANLLSAKVVAGIYDKQDGTTGISYPAFPNYIPFLCVNEDKALKMSSKELESIEAYKKYKTSTSSSNANDIAATNGANIEKLPF